MFGLMTAGSSRLQSSPAVDISRLDTPPESEKPCLPNDLWHPATDRDGGAGAA